MKNSGHFQIFAFALIASGFLLYVLADKQLIAHDFSFPKPEKKSEKIEQLYSDIEKELESVSDTSNEQKQKLKSLIKEVDQLDRQIVAQKIILKKLTAQTPAPVEAPQEKVRPIAIKRSLSPAKSLDRFIASTRKVIGQETLINFKDENGKQFLSVSPSRIYSPETFLLLPRGIQFAHIFMRAIKSLDVKSIKLKVLDGDLLAQQRAQVFEQLLTELSEGQITVATKVMPVGSFDQTGDDNFEIWIPFEGKSQGT